MSSTDAHYPARLIILSAPIGWAGEIETWLGSMPTDPARQLGVAWHVYGYAKGQTPPLTVLNAGYPIIITETFGLWNIGGYGWAASQGIGYTWWGWNDWNSQPLSANLSRPPSLTGAAASCSGALSPALRACAANHVLRRSGPPAHSSFDVHVPLDRAVVLPEMAPAPWSGICLHWLKRRAGTMPASA